MPGSLPTTQSKALWFTQRCQPEILDEDLREPGPDEVTIRAIVSLVSAGTEMLVYRGEIPAEDDLGMETAKGSFGFPVKYAYQVVGDVVAAGEDTPYRPGDRVFARHPHQDIFTMRNNPELLFRIPASLDPARAVFANLLDVALTANQDVPVRMGDVVVVYGHGVVGGLCAQLAARNAGTIIVVDAYEKRREAALEWGATAAVAPKDAETTIMELSKGRGADVSFEASGAPAAVQTAINTTGQEGTVVVISFFGGKIVPLVLSPQFHYGRLRIISSQVSSLGSGLQPRWNRERRMDVCLSLLQTDWLRTLISHRMPFAEAVAAYRLVDQEPTRTFGVLLDY